jgi:hypothetical protein
MAHLIPSNARDLTGLGKIPHQVRDAVIFSELLETLSRSLVSLGMRHCARDKVFATCDL